VAIAADASTSWSRIPEGWAVRTLGELAPLQRGVDLPSTQLADGPYPVVYSNGVMNFHSKAIARGPGVVTGRSGTLGKVHYVEQDFWPHNTSLWVTRFNGNSPRFIYYLYQSVGFDRFASGSGVPTLNRNDAHAFRVAAPRARSEQAAIAGVLSDADALIESLEQLLAKKRHLKQGAMQELLTGKKRLPGFSGKWLTSTLGAVSDIATGPFGTLLAASEYTSGEGVPLISVGEIREGFLRVTPETPRVPAGVVRRLPQYLLRKGDIVFGRKGAVDRSAIIGAAEDGWFLGSDGMRVRPTGQCDGLYLAFQFQGNGVRQWLLQNSTGTTMPSLNQGILSRVALALPRTIDEQAAIAAILSDIGTEIDALEAKLTKARQIKQGMMQELLTGRIRLV
jgi:type I restriction enzyme S subunit